MILIISYFYNMRVMLLEFPLLHSAKDPTGISFRPTGFYVFNNTYQLNLLSYEH